MMPTPRRTSLRAVLVGTALVALSGVVPTPAEAHTDLVSSSPAAGSIVGPGILDLTLTFDSPLVAEGTQILVRDRRGRNLAAEPVTVGARCRVRFSAATTGPYSVVYRAVAGDGHPISGEYEFRVSDPGTAGDGPGAVSHPDVDEAAPGADVESTTSTSRPGPRIPTPGWLVAGVGASCAAALLILGARGRLTGGEVSRR